MKLIKLFESLQSEDGIKEICKQYDIEDYSINNDMSIDVLTLDVYQNVNLYYEGLAELPLTFNRVTGDFDCYGNNLTSLKGSPRSCRIFNCSSNNLTSLEGSPDYCDEFYCYRNKDLKSLEFISRTPYVSIFNTKVASLKYLPNICNIHRNDILDYLLSLIGEENGYKRYRVTNIDLFNEYEVIDDNDYISGLKDKPSVNINRLKHFLEDVEIDKDIDIEELNRYYGIN